MKFHPHISGSRISSPTNPLNNLSVSHITSHHPRTMQNLRSWWLRKLDACLVSQGFRHRWSKVTMKHHRVVFLWVFPKLGVPQNGWFRMENPIKMGDLGGTTIFGNTPMGKGMVINQFYNSRVLWIPTIRILFIQQKDSHHEVHEYVPAQGTHDYAILMLPPVLKLSGWPPNVCNYNVT